MTWDDLCMVNLQSTEEGKWSYSAYGIGFGIYRTNKGLPDVFACIEEIMTELARTSMDEAGLKEESKAVFGVEPSDGSMPPAGVKTLSAVRLKRGKQRQRKLT